MDWDDLRYLLAVQREGSIGQAASALDVDPSTVARRIAALERALGAKLFDRTPRGYIPTGAGLRARLAAEAAHEALLALERDIGGQDEALGGHVRLTANEVLGAHVLPPMLARFCARYPEITLELVIDSRALDLASREADLALRLGRPSQPELVAQRVGTLGFGLYAGEGYLARSPWTPGDAPERHDWLVFSRWLREPPEREQLGAWLGGGRVALQSNSMVALLHAAAADAGLAFLPRILADGAPGLVRLPVEVPGHELWLVVHRDLRGAGRVRALRQHLAAELAELGQRLHGAP
jgi:DNA-binding transcriptional LysR family regulator